MGLIDIAKRDSEFINSDLNGWAVPQNWTHATALDVDNNPIKVTIAGRHVKHHLAFDDLGNKVNTKNASAMFSEKIMTDNGYIIRNAAGEVDMKDHLVQIKDSTGILYKYKVEQFFPDETLGMIVCILGAYE